MTLDKFSALVEQMLEIPIPHVRLGQRAFTVLSHGYQEIADDICGGPVDAFNDSSRLPAMLAYILEFHVDQPEALE
jgi:hypothetical protein